MPRVTQLQTNFTAGELSPRLYGRVDIARYQNGAERVRDLVPQIHGGAARRPGSVFVHAVKTSGLATRLIPFVRNNVDAYILEFGNLYMRVYKDGALLGAPYEIATPYATAKLFELDYTHGADTMFQFHEDVAPYKLVCAGDTSWTLTPAVFVDTPFEEPGTNPAATLYPSQATQVGATVTLVSGVASGAPVPISSGNLSWAGGVATVTSTGHGLATNDTVEILPAPLTWATVAAVTVLDADTFTYPLATNPGTLDDEGSWMRITGTAAFTAGMVGSSVKANGGVVKITSYVSTSVVRGTLKQPMTTSTYAPADAWSVHAPAWSASRGYPRTGTLYQQRLCCAGSPTFPQTIWGSSTGAYLNFSQGTSDDDAFAFTIASDVVNPVRYLASNKVLLAFTTGGEFTIRGGNEKPLTPTNAQIDPSKNFGCADVRPVRIGNSELFVQRAGRKVRSFGYSLANDEWAGPDLSVLAEHLTESGIVDMCWQQEPTSIVWLARGDGMLASITFDKDQDVTAWALHERFTHPDGEDGTQKAWVESLASIPTATGDEVWLVVRRTIGGSTVRYVERLTTDSTTDCAVIASGAASTVWGGLDHLEGETVHAVADGFYAGAFTVTSGAITLARAASSVNIGLNFIPHLKLLPPEIQTGMGSASGNAMRTSEVTVRFFETTGCKVNGKQQSFRQTGPDALDQPPTPFTGIKRGEELGWGRGQSDLEFMQEEPMPFHVLSITRKFTVNDG